LAKNIHSSSAAKKMQSACAKCQAPDEASLLAAESWGPLKPNVLRQKAARAAFGNGVDFFEE
jgi:hypothetical protein